MKRTLTLAMTGTRIEREYRQLVAALGEGPLDPTTLDTKAYPPEALARAQGFWRSRMDAEHRSVPVFLLLGAQLIEAHAPLDAKAIMLRMAQDELRHTEICGQVLAALGVAEPAVEIDAAVAPLATHAGTSVEECALRNVLYTTCLSEMVAVGRLVDGLEHTSDPFVRSAMRAIIADEVMHGQFGFLYLEALEEWLDARPEVRASLALYLRHAFAVLEREMCGDKLAQVTRPSEAARALGVLDPDRAREVFYGTLEEAVVPGLERHGIEARRAWRERAVIA